VVHEGQGLPFGPKPGDHVARVHARFDDFQGHFPAEGILLLGNEHVAEAPFADCSISLYGPTIGPICSGTPSQVTVATSEIFGSPPGFRGSFMEDLGPQLQAYDVRRGLRNRASPLLLEKRLTAVQNDRARRPRYRYLNPFRGHAEKRVGGEHPVERGGMRFHAPFKHSQEVVAWIVAQVVLGKIRVIEIRPCPFGGHFHLLCGRRLRGFPA
jgi:hypothetical protein